MHECNYYCAGNEHVEIGYMNAYPSDEVVLAFLKYRAASKDWFIMLPSGETPVLEVLQAWRLAEVPSIVSCHVDRWSNGAPKADAIPIALRVRVSACLA